MEIFLEYSLLGIAAGGVYALVALGFVVIFKASRTFNFAMGEMMMVSAYIYYVCVVLLKTDFAIGALAALAGSMLIALAMERFVLRPMIGRPVITVVMVTFGMASVMRGVVNLGFGAADRVVPSFLPRTPVMIGEMLLPGRTVRACVIAIAIVAALIVYFRYSRHGVALRAVAADQVTAYSMGIDVRRVIASAWMIAAVTGTFSGIMMATLNALTPHLGLVALNVLAVVILGGLDSIGGVLLAGFTIGWLESVTGLLFGTLWRDVTPYAAALVILLIKPTGLFGSREIERI